MARVSSFGLRPALAAAVANVLRAVMAALELIEHRPPSFSLGSNVRIERRRRKGVEFARPSINAARSNRLLDDRRLRPSRIRIAESSPAQERRSKKNGGRKPDATHGGEAADDRQDDQQREPRCVHKRTQTASRRDELGRPPSNAYH